LNLAVNCTYDVTEFLRAFNRKAEERMTMGCVDELASGHSDRGHRDRQAALLQLMDVVMRDQRFLLLYYDVDAWIVRDENFDINILFTEADDISNRNATFFFTEQSHLFD